MHKNKTYQTRTTLNDLSILYEKHIESFRPGLMPDLTKQSIERKKLFDSFIENTENMDRSSSIKEISDLFNTNQALLQLAEQKRKQLAEDIKAASRGKQVLKGYGQLNQRSKTPKVMSFKG